ncbi:iron complex outermembrane receptor protein [Flavobacterium sp. 5]|nr:iron complex outermembrane receptor protein [Flavobacterium sp. 5]
MLAQKEVSGVVKDKTGNPLPGANVLEKGTKNGVSTEMDGSYKLTVNEGATLIFSYIGYKNVTKLADVAIIDVDLSEEGEQELKEVQIVGSRNSKRTVVNSAVPIDIINIKDVTTQSGKIEINEILQYAAPSFNASKQSGSDGADHITPATLRGLGPDQTLVLINGKRRHQSSLVTLYGTKGRGNTGTDLNAIPSSSIKRIEILRDGAAAQYGSDAIAGVINIVMKDDVDQLTGAVTYGASNTNAKGDFLPGTANTKDFRLDQNGNGNSYGKNQSLDGGSLTVTSNYGVAIGDKGGYANFTGEYINKNKSLRPGYDFRKGFGDASLEGFNFFGNMVVPVSDKTEFYAFGGRDFRKTDAYAFTRNSTETDGDDPSEPQVPAANVVESVYPGGYTPRITSDVIDNSISAGLRTKTDSGWKVDISNTYGKNYFHYYIKGTINPSLEQFSPSEFDAGGHSLSQNTMNFDISKNYDTVLKGMNLAFGAEYRTENFEIFSGEVGSYSTYDINGIPVNKNTPASDIVYLKDENGNYVLDYFGNKRPRPGSSQGFPGYSPDNAVNKTRTNTSLYADSEFDVTENFLVSGAVRFENYSDFGSTLNWKVASRLKLGNHINLRGSVSTGFRAPSLAQKYYSLHFTNINADGAEEILLSANDSPVTKKYGIQQLKEETSLNSSLGFTATYGNFSATIDGYSINIENRIVLTSYFEDATAASLGVDKVQFFANAIDTKTLGLDIVLTWKKRFENATYGASLIGNINNMKIEQIHNGNLDQETFFGRREAAFVLASAPKNKFSLNLNYSLNKFDAGLAFTRFSEVVLVGYDDLDDVYSAKVSTDLTLGYHLTKSLKLSIGANNLFNIYPDKQDESGNTEAGGYWDAVQMGFNGAYYYTRLGFTF